MKVVFYTATSLDGFIATPDDDVAWLDALPQPSEDTYTPFLATVGALVMGRATYEFLLRHMDIGGAWPYPDHPCFVFTHQRLPARGGVTFVEGPVADAHESVAAAANGHDVWLVGGGDLAAQYLDAGLLDELVVTVGSLALGAGKPLFPRRANFTLQSARMLGSGFAELRYKT